MPHTSHAGGRVRLTLAVLFAVCTVLSAASGEADAKLRVIATLFPQYDFVRRIAGDRAEVVMLLPPGAESHSFEPTPSHMKAIAEADLFVYTGPHMEPWAKRLADAAGAPGTVTVVDASRGITLRRGEHDDHDHDRDHDDAHFHEFDPHVWLAPTLAIKMVDTIAAALGERDPAHAEAYAANAAGLRDEIAELDAAFEKTVRESPRRVLVFGERFAFAYFFARYGLEEVGAYTSCAPGAEPGLKAVIAVVEYVKANGVRYIYREASARSRISAVIAEEAAVDVLAVDSMHTLSAERLAAGATYVGLMRENMEAFAKGLQ